MGCGATKAAVKPAAMFPAGAKPAGATVIRLHDVQSLEKRKLLMSQVHDVIRQNYGG